MILAFKRRTLGLAAAGLLFGSLATAQPATIKLMVGFPPGGGTDAIARVLADKLKDQLGANVIVENKAGAGGQIAAQALKAAPADGSVLFLSHDHTISILPQVVKLDLQAVPYRGSAPMMGDMLGNQIAAGVGSVPDFIENHKAGKIRIVAVIGAKRQALLPDVPTFDELGLKGFDDLPYYGIFAPHGTPKATLDRYSDALAKVIALPEVRERLTTMGLTVGHMTSQQLANRERAYTKTWAKIIKDSGFQAQ